MHDLLLKSLGRGSELVDRLSGLARKSSPANGEDRFDRTGLIADPSRKLDVLYRSDDLLYVKYDKPSHSFWRAQELSLYWRHRHFLTSPVADFGCGDGSFAFALGQPITYGIDQDPETLDVARQYSIYESLIESEEKRIPLENQTVATLISNSVLEHVSDLPTILGELRRILIPSGKFMFSVPVSRYADHLTKYFGARTSEQVNRLSYHRNLLTEGQWRSALAEAGFAVDLVIHYQPDWYTFWYRFHRLSGPRALGRVVPDLDQKLWNRLRSKYISAVRQSIDLTTDGANIFVIAHRKA